MPENKKWYGVYRLTNNIPMMMPGLVSPNRAEAEMLADRLHREYDTLTFYVCEVSLEASHA